MPFVLRRVILSALLVTSAATLGGCGGSPSVSHAKSTPSPEFTVREVRSAFAAEGIVLALDYRSRGTAFLSAGAVGADSDVVVQVWPSKGPMWILFTPGHRVISARNVIVDFVPGSIAAGKAKAALKRLRRS